MAERRVIRHVSLRSFALKRPEDRFIQAITGGCYRKGLTLVSTANVFRTRNGGDDRVECVTPILTPAL